MSISDNKDRDKERRKENRKLRDLSSIMYRSTDIRIFAYFGNHLNSLSKLINGIPFVTLANKKINLLDSSSYISKLCTQFSISTFKRDAF